MTPPRDEVTIINIFTRLAALRANTNTIIKHTLTVVTALVAAVGSLTRTASARLASGYQRIPAGVRGRIPRRRTVLIGLVVLALLIVAPLKAFTGTASASTHTPKVPAVTAPATPTGKPAPTPPAPPAPPAPAAKPVQGVSPEQADNAKAIAQAAADRGLDQHATAIALATALQESNLKNINYGDRDSLGLFQQRPSAGWGTPEQILDPHYSAGKFLDRLAQVPDWQHMPVTVAAQTVQHSAFPDAYAKWEPLATDLAAQVQPTK